MNDSEIYHMSHVLRGSLQTALLNVQAVAVTLGRDDDAQASIRVAREELLRAGRMLVAAFDIVSLELGDVQRVNLRTLAARALAESGVDGVTLSRGPWPDVVGDARLLRLAIGQLAANACAATPAEARRPEIHASGKRGSVALEVRDWGRGFGAVTPPGRAFTASRPDHVATGLLTAQRIARLHRGTLSFASSPGGTTVSLALPRARRAR